MSSECLLRTYTETQNLCLLKVLLRLRISSVSYQSYMFHCRDFALDLMRASENYKTIAPNSKAFSCFKKYFYSISET